MWLQCCYFVQTFITLSFSKMKFLLVLVLELMAPVAMGLVTVEGRESSLLCAGEEVRYFCHSSRQVNSITWRILHPNNRYPSVTFSVRDGGRNETLSYSTGGLVSLNLAFSYTSTNAGTWSNLSVSVLDANYSIESLYRLKIDCEESMNYRQLEITGPPLPPTSLGYTFTSCTTTLSWLLPPSGSRDHHPADGLTLRYAPTPAARDEKPVLMELANDTTNVTLFLVCNMIYEVTLFATSTSCGESGNISINITSPGCLDPPSYLSYNFSTTYNGTQFLTTLSWLFPQSESRNYQLVLYCTPTPVAAEEEPGVMLLAYGSTNVSLFLLCNVTYYATLYATSCGGSHESNISTNFTLPDCKGSSQTLSTMIVMTVAAFVIGLLLIIIVVLMCCVIKSRAAKANGTTPPDGHLTEKRKGSDSTNAKVSMDECSAANVPMDSNLSYGVHMVSSTHFTPSQQAGDRNISGDSPGHADATEERSESPEHVYATIEEELKTTYSSQPTTGEDYDDVIP